MDWKFGVATSIGVAHVKAGIPCQDAAGYRVLTDPKGNTVLAFVVSDGAGSAARAEVGSALTTSTILDEIERYLHNGGALSAANQTIIEGWVEGARSAISVVASADGLTSRDYACTMLVVALGIDACVFAQIGDGAIVVADSEEEWSWIFWPQHGEFINMTTFVTEDSFRENLRVEVGRNNLREVAIFTDGIEPLVLHYATQTVHAPFFKKWFGKAHVSGSQGYDAELSKVLVEYLGSEAICTRVSDDKTLILACRRTANAQDAPAALQQ